MYEIFIIVAGTHYPIGKIPPTGFCRSYTFYNTSTQYIAVTVFVCQLLSLDLISITDIIYYYNTCARARVCIKHNAYTYVRVHMMRI